MKVDVAGENFGQLDGDVVVNFGFISGCKQRGLDGAAGYAGGRAQGRRFNARLKTLVGFFEYQAFEIAIILGAPAGAEFEQGVELAGFYGHIAASAAQQHLAGIGIGA